MSKPEIRKVDDDLYFVEWGRVRFGSAMRGLKELSAALNEAINGSSPTPAMKDAATPPDHGHAFETRCQTDINGAGVHREYWQECVNCHELFGEYDLITPCAKPAAPATPAMLSDATVHAIWPLLEELVESRKGPAQTFEEWWDKTGRYWNRTHATDCYEMAIARNAWNAALLKPVTEER